MSADEIVALAIIGVTCVCSIFCNMRQEAENHRLKLKIIDLESNAKEFAETIEESDEWAEYIESK